MFARLLASVSVSAVVLSAQVFVVDAANGAGTDFIDLPAAAAAVPDGATLRVRAGSYTPFTLDSKGLVFVGEGAVLLDRAGEVVLRNTQRNQTIVMRDIGLPQQGTLRIVNTLGPVVLERCHRSTGSFIVVTDITAQLAANVQRLGCNFDPRALVFLHAIVPVVAATDSSVSLAECRLTSNPGVLEFVRGSTGGVGLSLLRSRAVLSRCTIVGGAGGPGCRSCAIGCAADGGHGGAACRVEFSTVVALNSTLSGGLGGPRGCCTQGNVCTCPGNGGPGLELVNSSAYLLGSQPAGGAAGAGEPVCNAQNGQPIVQSGTNATFADATARPPVARIEGTQATGQNIDFTVLSPTGSVALMAIAYSGDLLPIEPIGFGSLLASAAGYFGPFVIPPAPGNALRLPWTIPNGFAPGQVHFGQFITLTDGSIFASNPFALVVSR